MGSQCCWTLQGRMDALDAARQRGELGGKDYGGVIGELQHGVALVGQRRQEDTATVAKLQDALQGVRIEGKKRCAELEALMVEEGEAKRQDFQTELNRQVAKVRSELKSGENKIQTWVQELLTEEVQRLTSEKL